MEKEAEARRERLVAEESERQRKEKEAAARRKEQVAAEAERQRKEKEAEARKQKGEKVRQEKEAFDTAKNNGDCVGIVRLVTEATDADKTVAPRARLTPTKSRPRVDWFGLCRVVDHRERVGRAP